MDNSNQPMQQGPATPPPTPAPQSPVGPTPPASVQPTPSAFQQPPKKKRTGLIIGIILGSVALIAIIAAVLVYFLWYQNPQKVVTDAVVGAVTSQKSITEGKITVKSDELNVEIDLKSSNDAPESSFDTTVKVSGDDLGDIKEFNLKLAGALSEDGVVYIKADGLQEIVDGLVEVYMQSMEAELRSYDTATQEQYKKVVEEQFSTMLDPIVSKIDGQWLKFTSADLSDNEEAKCMMDAMVDIQKDSSYMQEVGDAYRENPFIVLSDEKVESRDGAKGYEFDIKGMEGKGEDFGKALEDSKISKKLSDCLESSDSSDLDSDDIADAPTVRIWVDSMSHKLTEIEIVSKDDDMDLSMNLKFEIGKSNDIEIPSDAKDGKEVFEDIEDEVNALSGNSSYSSRSSGSSVMSGLSIQTSSLFGDCAIITGI